MTQRAVRVPLHRVQRDVHLLARSFPSEVISFYRQSVRPIEIDEYGQPKYDYALVYVGEVLWSETGATVTRYGLGQVEEIKPFVLIPGKRDVRPGDFFRRAGVLYQVETAPDYWPGFTGATCNRFEQGTSEPPVDIPA